MEIQDSRAVSGNKPEPEEVHGSVIGFIPAGDYILVRRLKAIEQDGTILRPDVAVELAERGVVIARGSRADEVPTDVIAKFSKYGAEEIHFDDEGQERYALVRVMDVRGWHFARY